MQRDEKEYIYHDCKDRRKQDPKRKSATQTKINMGEPSPKPPDLLREAEPERQLLHALRLSSDFRGIKRRRGS